VKLNATVLELSTALWFGVLSVIAGAWMSTKKLLVRLASVLTPSLQRTSQVWAPAPMPRIWKPVSVSFMVLALVWFGLPSRRIVQLRVKARLSVAVKLNIELVE